jgi:hypothetical protein
MADPGNVQENPIRPTLKFNAAALVIACVASPAYPQAGKLGAYTGTVSVSGAEIGTTSRTDFAATIKVSLPIEKRDGDSIRAEAEDIDKPSAMATITRWDLDARNSGPGADGKIVSWKCSLAAPTEVPMNAQGSLDVDLKAKKHAMFVALVALKPIPLNCVNSRSGAYKEKGMAGLFFGTSEPELIPANALPFADPARLTAKFKLMPAASMKGRYSPVDMEWDLKLTK